MPAPLIRQLPLVGLYFRDAATKDAVRKLVGPGHYGAKLVPEPTNAHDPHAVQVVLPAEGNLFIGYVPATVSALVALWLSQPEPCHITVEIQADKQLPKLLLSVSV